MNLSVPNARPTSGWLKGLLALCMAFIVEGCYSQPSPDYANALPQSEANETQKPARVSNWDAEKQLEQISMPAAATPEYLLGPGDGVQIDVIGQAEISGSYRLGPDGSVSVPIGGLLKLRGLTREQAAELLRSRLEPFFTHTPSVNLAVTDYENNKAYILGDVERPGVVDLTGAGSLLQALAEAGGLPAREFRSFLTKCSVIRGKDQILWIDLGELLQQGNIALNVPLHNGDVVFIPDSEDAIIYVMGEVESPGAVAIKVRLDLVQAVARAGGTTEDADLESVYLIRSGPNGEKQQPVRIDLKHLIETGDFSANLELKTGDVIFVARTGFGDLNYVLRKLDPGVNALTLGAALR